MPRESGEAMFDAVKISARMSALFITLVDDIIYSISMGSSEMSSSCCQNPGTCRRPQWYARSNTYSVVFPELVAPEIPTTTTTFGACSIFRICESLKLPLAFFAHSGIDQAVRLTLGAIPVLQNPCFFAKADVNGKARVVNLG